MKPPRCMAKWRSGDIKRCHAIPELSFPWGTHQPRGVAVWSTLGQIIVYIL